MLCIPNGSAVFRKPTRDRSVRMVESYSPGNCNLQPQVVRRVHWCSPHVHGWSKDALHQAARLVYTLTIFTAREHRPCSQVVNVCLVQCTYMSTACIHGPYSPVLGTHYPCSRPVNAAIDPTHLCTAHCRQSLYFRMGRPSPFKIAPSHGWISTPV